MSFDPIRATAAEAIHALQDGQTTALMIVEAHLARIEKLDKSLGAYTAVLRDRALEQANSIDRRRAQGKRLGPLAGAVFSVKNLFDVTGLPTLAGSRINVGDPPATRDGFLVRQLTAADAILIGSLNMGEYAYDFTGENQHYGPSRNPHDASHMSGGSSGGSGTAAAAGMAHVTLGSDTNGSIRVPASFCGLFGLKPTYGRLSRGGSFPFVSSLDHLGPMARSPGDLARFYDVMQGSDPEDPAQATRAPDLVAERLELGVNGLRIAVAGGYFARQSLPLAQAAVAQVAGCLDTRRTVELPEVERARAAAFLITMSEGANLHLGRLRTRAGEFDLDVRDRLIAGAMVPGVWVTQAQKFRRWYREAVLRLFEDVDVILAPSTPVNAPKIGQKMMTLDGVEMPVRANIGIYTQPISFIGLPVAAVPVWLAGETLPIGVQIMTAPWREDLALRVARVLEQNGVCRAPVAAL